MDGGACSSPCVHVVEQPLTAQAPPPPTIIAARWVVATSKFRLTFSRAIQSASIAVDKFNATTSGGAIRGNTVQAWVSNVTHDLTVHAFIGSPPAAGYIQYVGGGGLTATDDAQPLAPFGPFPMPNV